MAKNNSYPPRNFQENSDNSVELEENEELYDKCVICGRVTPFLKDTPIELRSHYIVGCGQLCDDCYYNLY